MTARAHQWVFRHGLALVLCVAGAIGGTAAEITSDNARRTVQCGASTNLVQLGAPLPRTSGRLKAGQSVTIVALGSSSTYGTGASDPSRSYPSRLEVLLRERFRDTPLRVINRDVLAEQPDLVIWQVGSNAVLQGESAQVDGELVRRGVERLRVFGADVILMNMQYAPALIAHPRYRDMLREIAVVARTEGVGLFRRFGIMRAWAEEGQMPLRTMLAPDRLHMNDLGYDCIARSLAESIVATIRSPREGG